MPRRQTTAPRAATRARPDLVLPERLDVSNVAAVRYALDVVLDMSRDDVVLDCAEVAVVDTAGLGLLVAAHRRCRYENRRLVLVEPQPRLRRILAVTRLHRVLYVDRAHAG